MPGVTIGALYFPVDDIGGEEEEETAERHTFSVAVSPTGPLCPTLCYYCGARIGQKGWG